MTSIAMETPYKWRFRSLGKSSISMGHGFHGYVSHNQRVSQLEIPRPLFDSTRKPHPNPRPFHRFRRTSGSSGHIRFSKDSSVGDHQANHARLVKKHTLANNEKPRPLCKCPMMVFTMVFTQCVYHVCQSSWVS